MIYDYSSDSSDELIVGENDLKKLNRSNKSSDYYEEEEENKEQEKKDENNSNAQNKPIIVKEKHQNQVSQKKDVPSQSYSSDSEEIYEVEEIVDHRKKKGKLQYFLKWVGYPSSDNTWEFEEDLNCPDLVKEYWQKKGNAKVKKSELKIFQKKELEIRKKKITETNISQNNHQNDKKNKIKKNINQNLAKTPQIFRQIRFPFYDIAKSKTIIKSINGFKISEQGIVYHVLLNNDDIVNLSSNEVQSCNPNILINYFEKKIMLTEAE